MLTNTKLIQQNGDFTMEEKQFHMVEPSTIKQITVEDIMIGKGISSQNLNYSSPIPTRPIGIPQRSRDIGLQVIQTKCGAIDYGTFMIGNSELEGYRGRLGC